MKNSITSTETAEKKLKKLREENKTLDMDENFVIFMNDNAIDFQIIHYNREKEIVTFHNKIYGEIQIPVQNKGWYNFRRSQVVQMLKLKMEMKNKAADIISKLI